MEKNEKRSKNYSLNNLNKHVIQKQFKLSNNTIIKLFDNVFVYRILLIYYENDYI